MERDLDCRSFVQRDSVCKWINQYKKLIDIVSIVFDSIRDEYVVFFYWNKVSYTSTNEG